METFPDNRSHASHTLIRAGGVALLLGLGIHIVANVFIKQFPPPDPTLDELRGYLAAEAGTWQLVHGMRYLAVASLAVFFAGMFSRVRGRPDGSPGGWEYVGLIGGMLLLANLFITNGIETFVFLDCELQAERPELFWLLFHATRVLFTAEIAAWSILIFGFSMAGWKAGTLPRFHVVLGALASSSGLPAGTFVGVVMTGGGWPAIVLDFASIASLLWFLAVGLLMLALGADVRRRQD